MAFITAPAFRIRSIRWSLDRPSQNNVSAWTGRRTVVANPWHGKWSAKVELAPIVGEANARVMRSFLARCRGSINTFRVYATEGPQNSNSGVTVAVSAAAGDTSMSLAGLSTTMEVGQFITVNGQLLCLTNGGSGVAFEPALRQAANSGTIVVTSRPYALVYMTDSAQGWGIDAGQVYGIAFDVEEAILEADGVAPEATAPTLQTLTGSLSVPENSANGTVVGTPTGYTAGSTKSLSNNAGGRFAINSSSGQISVANGTLLDYETATSHNVTIVETLVGATGSPKSTTLSIAVSDVADTASPTATFTMTQLAAAKRVYQRTTTSGGGQSKGQGTIPVTINVTVVGAIYARVRASDGTTVVQAPWLVGTVGGTGSQTINVSGVDARLGWFYLDLGDGASSWQAGSVLVGMGRVVAVSGQSLAARMFREMDGQTATNATLGVTINANGSVYASYQDNNIYPVPTTTAPSWAVPADASNYNSTFAAEYLNRVVNAAGVNCGLIGHTRGAQSITAFLSGGTEVTALRSRLDEAGGFEAFILMIGHSDAGAGMSGATFQTNLTTLFTDLTSHNAVRGSSYEKYIATIPNITVVNTWGTQAQITAIRAAARTWAAANSAVSVEPVDLTLIDGVHQSQAGSITLADHFYRASRTSLGLSHNDAGPTISSVSRASGSANVVVTMSLPSGATSLSGAGTYASRFRVASSGNVAARSIASSLIAGSTITLTLSSTPANNAPLDVHFGYPYESTNNGAADMVYDNNTDGDGLSTGRQVVPTYASPVVAAAPVPSLGPTLTSHSVTYGTGATGFGADMNGGWAAGAAALGDDVIPYSNTMTLECRFKLASAPGGTIVLFSGSDLWLGVTTAGKLTVNPNGGASATGATTVSNNAWHHVRVVCEGLTATKLYLDGVLEATAGAHAPGGGSVFQLGALVGTFLWTGELDEFAAWSIATNSGTFTPPTAPYAGTETGLYSLYHLNSSLASG